MSLQLLLTSIVIGVGIEQLDKCVPSMFHEALSSMVTIGNDGLTGCNEDSIILWHPVGFLPPRRLVQAWWRVEIRGIAETYLRLHMAKRRI